MRRAAFSVAANMVEGFAHSPGKVRVNFLKVSQASLAEVGYCLHVALRLGYITAALATELEVQVKEVGAPLAGLIRAARLKLATKVGIGILLISALMTRLV